MVSTILLGLLLLFTQSLAVDCPQGSIDYGDRQECIYPVNSNANYTNARQICLNLNGRLIQIYDIFENGVTATEAEIAIGRISESFIGVINTPNQVWTYDDGTPLQYHNWMLGHPLSNASCVVQNAQSYQWISVGCDESHTFICSIPEQTTTTTSTTTTTNTTTATTTTTTTTPATTTTTLPTTTSIDPCSSSDGWVRYDRFCYYFHNVQLEKKLNLYNQSEAEKACEKRNATLASIHSDDEFNFLKKQIKTSYPVNLYCERDQALIGLTCVWPHPFSWMDGTQFDYDQTRGQCNDAYAIVNDDRCGSVVTYWDDWTDSHTFTRYICKKTNSMMII